MRALAECKAKRAIMAEHERSSAGYCQLCVDYLATPAEHLHAPCLTVLAIAQVYADHPNFDPAWVSG